MVYVCIFLPFASNGRNASMSYFMYISLIDIILSYHQPPFENFSHSAATLGPELCFIIDIILQNLYVFYINKHIKKHKFVYNSFIKA